MSTLAVLATIFGLLMSVSNLPQTYKIFKRKSAKDLSILTLLILFFGGIFWILYGAEISNTPLVLTNSIGTLCVLSVIVGWFMYGRDDKA